MKQDPSRGGGSTLSPAYSAALEALAKKRKENNEDKPWYEDVAGGIGGALKYVYDNAPSSNPVSTPLNMGGGIVSMGGQGTGKSLVTEPARLAVRRAVGDVTAIPGVGEPSSSYTADQVRQQGVVRGVVGAGIDYLQFLPVVAKGTRVAGDVVNASKLAAMERRANPFPALRGEISNAIDVVEGSRLPATVVETPSNPYRTTRNALAEDMAQAQVPRPTVTPATISPRLEVPTIAPTVPDMPPGFPLPEVPSNMTLLDFQRMPEYQAYIEAGRSIDPRAMAGFAFDPETAYLVHSGRGQLIGGKLDPHRTISSLNEGHLMGVMRGHDSAVLASESLQDALDTFVRTGVWNGDELARRMPPGYSSEGGKFPLKGVVKASDMTDEQLQAFVNTIQERINRHTDFVSQARPYLSLARREPFMSYYPAPVGAREGYMRWHSGPEGGGMYLAGVPADRATTLFGPGIYEKRLGVPEWQAFGAQTPIAGITGFPTQWGYGQFPDEMDAITRAFAVQKTIEDRIRRGFYGRAEGRRLIPEVTAPQAGRTMNPVEELAAAKARAATHIGTVSRGPVDEISAEFPDVGNYYVNEGGVPNLSSSRTNTFSMPVYDVGGKKVAFGPKSLGRYSPEFKNADVEIIPIDPYVITGQSAGSKLGDEYAELFFAAVYRDTLDSPQSGQMSALLYAASRGDKVAMRELQSVANANRALMAQERSAYYTNRLAFMGDQPASYDWAANDPAQMVVVGRDETGAAITRPATIDDLFVVHQTSYKPTYDNSGNIVIKPVGDHVYIDPATGKQAVDQVTGEVLDPRRDTIHFTLNHPVAGHIERPTPTGKTYVIVVPLRDVLDANPESLDNLLSVDTWFTPKPGEGLVIPMKSGQVVELSSVNDYAKQQGLTYIEIKPEDLADTPYEILSYRNDIATQSTRQNNALVQQALRQVGQAHNQNPDYQTNLFPIGENINRDQAISRRITFLAGEEIPAQYPSLGTSVSNDLHFYTPIAQFEKNFGRYITPGESRRVSSQNLWSLSPNARKRLFRRNTFMSGKFEMNESDWGL